MPTRGEEGEIERSRATVDGVCDVLFFFCGFSLRRASAEKEKGGSKVRRGSRIPTTSTARVVVLYCRTEKFSFIGPFGIDLRTNFINVS